jgi:hypothetical protein
MAGGARARNGWVARLAWSGPRLWRRFARIFGAGRFVALTLLCGGLLGGFGGLGPLAIHPFELVVWLTGHDFSLPLKSNPRGPGSALLSARSVADSRVRPAPGAHGLMWIIA